MVLKRVYGVAETFRHLVAILVKHEAVGNHRLVRFGVEHHPGDGVEGEEPSTCLVYSLGDEVGGVAGS